MEQQNSRFRVFISHSSIDTWVARQISLHVGQAGAETFLDEADIAHGDDFEQRIIEAAPRCTELLVLLTPWAVNRPYIWMEVGIFWASEKRIVTVLHGITKKELAKNERIPILMKGMNSLEINEIDKYFASLRQRVSGHGCE